MCWSIPAQGPAPLHLDQSDTHSAAYDLIVLSADLGWGCRFGRDMRTRAIQVLDPSLVILTELQRIGETVEGGHHCPRLSGVLQAQDVSKLMGRHLEEVCACGGSERSPLQRVYDHRTNYTGSFPPRGVSRPRL